MRRLSKRLLQEREILAAEDATEHLDGEKEGILGMNPAQVAWIETAGGNDAVEVRMDYSPSFSTDGKWVVFTSERNGSADIYRVHLDGSSLERLTDDPAYDDQGVLSPDGKTLAFVSSRGTGRAHIWLLDLASKQARLLTPNSGSDFRPAWSPDGRWLAFSSDRDSRAGHLPGRWEKLQSLSIYVVHPDRSDLHRVTRGRGVAGSPRWSLDGKRIYYYETTELGAWYAEFGNESKGTTEIVSIGVADGTLTQQTTGDGIRISPQALPDEALGYLTATKAGPVLRIVQHDGATIDSKPTDYQGPWWSTDGKHVVYYKFSGSDKPEVVPAFSRVPGLRLVKLANGIFFPSLDHRKLPSKLEQNRLTMEKCPGKVAAAGFGFPAVCGNFKWNRSSRSCVKKV